MWIPEIRTAPWLGAAMLAATAQPAQATPGYALGRCLIDQIQLPAQIVPTIDGGSYLFNYHGEDPRYQEKLAKGEFFEGAKVTLVKAPKHGKVVYSEDPLAVEFKWYSYQRNKGYEGRDRFVMQVEKDGVKVRIHYVVEVLGEETASGHCDPGIWKISHRATPPSVDTIGVGSVSFDPLLNFAGIGGLDRITLDFASLASGALGQTTGTAITLDWNAAGHGWFIDPTPDLNEEFLPTADPNVWKAKPGSAAEGRMDLLSVLLHEYGHALGLDHSAEGHDYMAATLQPGVRRLPTADEMAQLVALATGAKPATPDTPIPPSLPLGGGLSALLLGRLRGSRFGSWSPVFDSLQLGAQPQYAVGANPSLTNPGVAERLFNTSLKDVTDQLRKQGLSGEALQKKAVDELRLPAIGCFVAGTLVHTKEGLKPIEQIKVGDWVLSRPENPEQGTETGYKRVTKTFRFEDKEVVRFWWAPNAEAEWAQTESVYVTPNHPVWLNPNGWVAMGRLTLPEKRRPGFIMRGDGDWLTHELILADGTTGSMLDVFDLYRTDKPTIAFKEEDDWGLGTLYDFSGISPIVGDSVPYDYETWGDPVNETRERYTTTVYNFEVEDWHTYFVGKTGLWVHNTNCADATLTVQTKLDTVDALIKGAIQMGSQGTQFKKLTKAELNHFLKNNPDKRDGFGVIRMDGAGKYKEFELGDIELPKGLAFEDGGPGRLIDAGNGTRYEYAVRVTKDACPG